MDCKERTDQIFLYAAGALDPAEADPVRQHLACGCPTCAGELAEAQATMSLLALTLPPVRPAEKVRDRLLSRLDTQNRPLPMTPLPQPVAAAGPQVVSPPWWMLLLLPSAIAAAIAAGFTIFYQLRLQANQPGPTSVVMGAPEDKAAIRLLTDYIDQQSHQMADLRTSSTSKLVQWAAEPNLKMIYLPGTDQQPAGARGRIFWDSAQGDWHFFASGLKPAESGKTYELWFVSADKKVAAGAFDPNANGDAAVVTHVPPGIDPTIAAVTDEPAKTTITAPTGNFQLMGKLP